MLSKFTKYVLVNNSGATIDFDESACSINLKIIGWYISPTTGKITYAETVEDDMGFDGTDTIVNGGEVLSSEVDNSTNLYLGHLVQLEIVHDEGAAALAASGSWDLKVEGGDTTGELTSDAAGYTDAETAKLQTVGSMMCDGGDHELIRSQVFHVGG